MSLLTGRTGRVAVFSTLTVALATLAAAKAPSLAILVVAWAFAGLAVVASDYAQLIGQNRESLSQLDSLRRQLTEARSEVERLSRELQQKPRGASPFARWFGRAA